MSILDAIPLKGRMLAVAILLGLCAVAALSGAFSFLPGPLAFFMSSLAIVFFPGTVIAALLLPSGYDEIGLPERLAIAFVSGLGVITLSGFLAIVLRLSLARLAVAMAVTYAVLLAVLILRWLAARGKPGGAQGGGWRDSAAIVLLVAAVMLAGVTLWSPRDMDDWFYLAYIADYVEGVPVNTTDALMGPGYPSPPRAWFGSWWVAEALLAGASGAHPVAVHQVYIPLLVVPFAVLAVFMLAVQVFGSRRIAYLACFLQVLFYLSSAVPSDTAGWALFARAAQDKSLAFLVPAVVAASLGLRLAGRSRSDPAPVDRGTYALYSVCALTAGLVHPMGLVWCAVTALPFSAAEALRARRARPAAMMLMLVAPLIVSSLLLLPGAGATSLLEDVEPGPYEGQGMSTLVSPYLPGQTGKPTAGDRVLAIDERTYVAHPLLVTRYPMAIAGLVLALMLPAWWRRSCTARFLIVLTASVLVLAFVPGVAGAVGGVITRKMLYRLTWLLPWGFIIAFYLGRLRASIAWKWAVALAIMIALCRANPGNYLRPMAAAREGGRPDPEFVEAARALEHEAPPRGVVLADASTGLMIPAHVSGAYPAFVSPAYSSVYRSRSLRTARELRDLLAFGVSEEDFPLLLSELRCRYILVRNATSMAAGLDARPDHFRPVFSNSTYGLWKVDFDSPPEPGARD